MSAALIDKDADFPLIEKFYDKLSNYDFYEMPNGIYRCKELICDNYLYPVYHLERDGEDYYSTSAHALIRFNKKFERNVNFQNGDFIQPTYRTADVEVKRVRSKRREFKKLISDKDELAKLAANLMQKYTTEMEEKFSDYHHVLLMGGKDSQNILLCERKTTWSVVTSEPNCDDNQFFIDANKIPNVDYIKIDNNTDNTYLEEEIISTDCFYDPAHFRYVPTIKKLWEKHDGKIVLWMGTGGDGILAKAACIDFDDLFDFWALHVGVAMGVLHQLYKNLFDIPCLSHYQSPEFLDEYFYKYDPEFVRSGLDIRPKVGELMYGKKINYPSSNHTPGPWGRDRKKVFSVYINNLEKKGVNVKRHSLKNFLYELNSWIFYLANKHSSKKRTKVSKVLYPLRKVLAGYFRFFKIKRYSIIEKS